jgi:hypothetical protein
MEHYHASETSPENQTHHREGFFTNYYWDGQDEDGDDQMPDWQVFHDPNPRHPLGQSYLQQWKARGAAETTTPRVMAYLGLTNYADMNFLMDLLETYTYQVIRRRRLIFLCILSLWMTGLGVGGTEVRSHQDPHHEKYQLVTSGAWPGGIDIDMNMEQSRPAAETGGIDLVRGGLE